MATMRDVARVANVSIATVSRVINGSDYVSPELVARVKEAMAKCQYQPNRIARSLRTKQSHTLSLIISDISNPFFSTIVRGAEDAANERGFHVIISNTDEDPVKENEVITVIQERRPDGFIVAPTGIMEEGLKQLIHQDIPLVFVDRIVEGVNVHAVLSDNIEAARQATSYLLQLGHTRIGIILGSPHLTPSQERLEGYKEALSEVGIPIDDDLIVTGYFEQEGGERACQELLDLKNPPSAIVIVGAAMAIGAVSTLKRNGISCPRDISIVAFNNFPWMESFDPPLTTVAQQPYQMGYQAAETIIDMIEAGEKPRPEIKRLECVLKIRSSTSEKRNI